ncbi:MAG: DUF1553 domain-containing protein [Verrucomicrobiae bacterium]|nr:DUF1553 domain-containing protein [Verrucomicrobiae bacterium]
MPRILIVVCVGLLSIRYVAGEEPRTTAYSEPLLTSRDRSFWAFLPPGQPTPPIPGEHPIDAFLLTRLRETGIADFAPPASPETLRRRLSITLTGLPPEGDASDFAGDLEALLSSPHYGERWAQHWLDLARFAETDGFEFDAVRPDAWRYRDWVVSALNADLPYDRFVAMQIAGDLLDPGSAESAAATGFLLSGPDMPDLNLQEERRHLILNGITGSIGSVFLGITLECAECHDHKTDPVSQADFYRLRAIFEDFALPGKKRSLPVAYASGERFAAHLYFRGDFRRPGPALSPAVPAVLSGAGFKPEHPRLDLASEITRPDHPLTSRVIVNRVWQHHFGTGLVPSSSDFGKLGDRPTHPELLDWLTVEFVRHGWSLKWLHREIISSRAWQQSSLRTEDDPDWEKRLSLDPDDALLSRRPRLRLDGETVRDFMLSISGRLNPAAGGPGVRPPLPPEVASTLQKNQWPVTEDRLQQDRRSLYLFARRNLRYPLFEVLDRPDANQSCARRHVSTTAPQALTLLNDPFIHDMADATAANLAGLERKEAISRAYQRILGRSPTGEESRRMNAFLDIGTMHDLVLALFNVNEFLYLD